MSGKIAAARAFLSAGNSKLALQNLEEALQDDPDDGAALEVYCDALRDLARFEEAERVSRDWLARAPNDVRAHVQLIVTLFARQNRRGARQAIDAFRTAAPWDGDSHDYLETLYQARFGDQPKGLNALAERARLEGDKKTEFRFSSYAAEKRNNIGEAIMEGEFARRTGDDSPELAAYLSMLCFRSFRMGRCRKYARIALAKQPGMPAPTELLYLSWLVLFPPFLLTHLCLFIWTKLQGASLPAQVIGYLLAVSIGPLLGLWIFVLFDFLMSFAGVNTPMTLALMLAWACYAPFIGSIASLFTRRKPKEIQLADY